MKSAPLPLNESARLHALHRLEILDTPPEVQFDDLARLASQFTECPIALVSLIDHNRQWFKSHCGLKASQAERDTAFCAHAILEPRLMVVEDALLDERFADNPLVLGEPFVRFYAGMPLISKEGFAYGTLCVVDTQPRRLTDSQQEAIIRLARQVLYCMETRHLSQQRHGVATHLARLFEFLPDGLITADSHGNIEHVNSIARRWHGVDPGSITRQQWSEYFELYQPGGKHRLPLADNPVSQVLRGETVLEKELVIRARGQPDRLVVCNGDYMHDATGKRVGAVVVMRDITSQTKVEETARLNAERFKRAFSAAVQGIALVSISGRWLEVNDALCAMFGYTRDELLKLDFQQLSHTDDLGTDLDLVRQTLEGEISHYQLEKRYFKKTGEIVNAQLSVSLVRDSRGLPLHFVTQIQDITSLKRMEKMKDEFVSTISHELRTPLTSIAGALSLIQGGVMGEVPVTMQEMVDVAAHNCRRLSTLINDLLDMEKLIAGKMPFVFADHALVPLLDAAIKSMQSYAGPLAVTLVRQGDDPATVRVDAIRFEQVITNLLSNACKFSPKNSDVIIMHRLDGNEVEISVIDSGSGIPAAFRDRLFQKFSQADSTSIRSKGGTGLGLVICKQLLQRMGGMIGFESNQTRGTRFWVRLPLQ